MPMRLLYSLSVSLYTVLIRLASPFNGKASQWCRGRRRLLKKMQLAFAGNSAPVAWFHCSSLGEFEQGRPLMEAFRKKYPGYKILLTFFSPSGYEVRKKYSGADYVFYLPADTPSNARRMIEIVQPEIVFFVKYEYWFNYIRQLKRRQIPLLLVSAVFREKQYFFRWHGQWAAKQLRMVSHFYVQHESAEVLLQSIGIQAVTVSGDTRFDRVVAVAAETADYPLIEQFSRGKKLLMAGSSWPADEDLILSCREFLKDYKILFVPHLTGHAAALKERAGNAVLYTQWKGDGEPDTMVVDTMGHLSKLYRYATVAYIGGGFGSGIHNLLEAAVYGKPVLFGPAHGKFHEASGLLNAGGAFCVSDKKDMEKVFSFLKENVNLHCASEACRKYVFDHAGATGKVLSDIHRFLKTDQP